MSCSGRPVDANLCGYATAEEKKRPKGAPFWIWEKKLPDEPNDTGTCFPVCFAKRKATSLNTNSKSEAAAILISCALANMELKKTRRIRYAQFTAMAAKKEFAADFANKRMIE